MGKIPVQHHYRSSAGRKRAYGYIGAKKIVSGDTQTVFQERSPAAVHKIKRNIKGRKILLLFIPPGAVSSVILGQLIVIPEPAFTLAPPVSKHHLGSNGIGDINLPLGETPDAAEINRTVRFLIHTPSCLAKTVSTMLLF
jgi:hypothetical protein